MSFEGLVPVSDVSPASWLATSMRGFGGLVRNVVPDCFPAHARVLHPAHRVDGSPATWAQVCTVTGARAHSLMQWWAIAGEAGPDTVSRRRPVRRWQGTPPEVGELQPPVLRRLLRVVASGGGSTTDCCHAVWEGWGWLDGGETVGRLQLPHRSYLLFRGSAHAASAIGRQVTPDWFIPQSPSLLWPADRGWCLATEIDFDSTLVAGSQVLIDAILQDPELEAWPVYPDDDLTARGDLVNS